MREDRIWIRISLLFLLVKMKLCIKVKEHILHKKKKKKKTIHPANQKMKQTISNSNIEQNYIWLNHGHQH